MTLHRKYRIAIVGGAGYWGSRYTQAYYQHPDCTIIALVDSARERRDEFAGHYGIPVVYDSVEDLLSRDIPDICSIVLPVSASAQAVFACAEAGVKVITCEKPISESLERADTMVQFCRERGVSLFCGTALWEIPHLQQTARWAEDGNIGAFVKASIPSGLHAQVSGNGCVILCFLRFLTGREVEWVEGWTDPPEAALTDEDCNAYGRLGLTGGLICDVPSAAEAASARESIYLEGDSGLIRLTRKGPTLIQGTGTSAHPVFPDFLEEQTTEVSDHFVQIVSSFCRRFDQGGEAECSGHDYRQALEIAIALKLSARENHRRIELPLKDRHWILNPVPYRMLGGDVTGWDAIGLKPPQIRVSK